MVVIWKVVLFGQKLLYSGKSGCIGEKLLYSGKLVVFRQSDCIRARSLFLGKSGSIWTKVVVLGQKWLYSGKSGCIRAK